MNLFEELSAVNDAIQEIDFLLESKLPRKERAALLLLRQSWVKRGNQLEEKIGETLRLTE